MRARSAAAALALLALLCASASVDAACKHPKVKHLATCAADCDCESGNCNKKAHSESHGSCGKKSEAGEKKNETHNGTHNETHNGTHKKTHGCPHCACGHKSNGTHSFHGKHEDHDFCTGHHSNDGLDFFEFLLISVFLGVATLSLHRWLGSKGKSSLTLPFTIVIFMIGYLIGSFHYHFGEDAPFLIRHTMESIDAWKTAHPHVILYVLLPPLLFEDAVAMDYYVFRKNLAASVLLAGPGVLITMGITAVTSSLIFNAQGIAFATHMLLGSMLAATDPVAVVAALKDLGAPDRLNLVIAGESLLNDGTAVVLFLICENIAITIPKACEVTAVGVITQLVQLAAGGVLVGWAASQLAYQWLKHVRDQTIEITILLVIVYATFWASENIFHVSGVLATVVLGVQTSCSSYLSMDEETRHGNHAFWQEVGFVCTTIIFLISGLLVGQHTHRMWEHGMGEVHEIGEVKEYFALTALLCIALQFIRLFAIFSLSPILARVGYGFKWQEGVIMTWGGLRGAVSLSLALLVFSNEGIDLMSRDFILLQTSGVVMWTLIINGTTTSVMYKWLKLFPEEPYRIQLMEETMHNLHHESHKFVHRIKLMHWFHKHANTAVVYQLMPNFGQATLVDGKIENVPAQDLTAAWQSIPWLRKANSTVGLRAAVIRVQTLLTVLSTSVAVEEEEDDSELCDPYFTLMAFDPLNRSIVPTHRQGAVHTRTTSPKWDPEESTFEMAVYSTSALLRVQVYDWEFSSTDTLLGEADFSLQELFGSAISPTGTGTKTLKDVELTDERDGPAKQDHGYVSLDVSFTGAAKMTRKLSEDGGHGSGQAVSGLKLIGYVKVLVHGALDLHSSSNRTGEKHNNQVSHESHHAHGEHGNMYSIAVERLHQFTHPWEHAERALYDILLLNITSIVVHANEEHIIGAAATTALQNAIGAATDYMGDYDAESADAESEGLDPLGELWDNLEVYVNAEPWGSRLEPVSWFTHRIECTEAMYVFIHAMHSLVDDQGNGSMHAEYETASKKMREVLERAEAVLDTHRRRYKYSFKAIQGLFAYRAVSEEMRHRVDTFLEHGFLNEKVHGEVMQLMEQRDGGLRHYFSCDIMTNLLGIMTCNSIINQMHPANICWRKDIEGRTLEDEKLMQSGADQDDGGDSDDDEKMDVEQPNTPVRNPLRGPEDESGGVRSGARFSTNSPKASNDT